MESPKKLILPTAFESTLKNQLGASYPDFINSLHQPSPTSIRLHPIKKTTLKTDGAVPWCDTGHYLNERPVFTLDPAFHAGAYYVQEASSMFLEQALTQSTDLSKPLIVLDLCAAPGGKSTHLLSLLSPDSLLVANEVIRSRATVLSENIQKSGYTNNVVVNNDPEAFAKLNGMFDVIVVDAPCSGEGLFRKDANAVNEWSEENVALCSTRQRRIISDVWPALKTGGILIYSTCTYNAAEDEENIAWIKSQHNVESVSIDIKPEWGIDTVDYNGIKGYRFYPHHLKGEGFFIAVLRRQEENYTLSVRKGKKFFHSPTKSIQARMAEWLTTPEEYKVIQRDALLQLLPAQHLDFIELLAQKLYLISAGAMMATLKHEKLIPEHNIALTWALNRNIFPQLELTKEEALQYLRKETSPTTGSTKGFTLMLYQGLGLGFANVLDNRMNNLYPAAWRVRM